MDDQLQQLLLPCFRIFLCGAFRVEKRVGESYLVLQAADWGGSNYPRLLRHEIRLRYIHNKPIWQNGDSVGV